MTTEKNYLTFLKFSYALECTWTTDMNKATYLAEYIFNFTTYDDDLDKQLVEEALEVAQVITNGANYAYIKAPEKYKQFIMYCQMPFFADRIEWGSSIRGAWWMFGESSLISTGFWTSSDEQLDKLIFRNRDEWHSFIKACVKFYTEKK